MLPVGTVLFTSRAGIGKVAILRKEACTNQGFQSIVPRDNVLDSYFIFSRSEELKKYGETVGAGSTFVEVSGKQMANMDIMMPTTLDEQKQIGEYFEKIDHLITLHQHKLFPVCYKVLYLHSPKFSLKSYCSTLYQPFALPVSNPSHEVHDKLSLESLPESSSRPLNSVYYKTIDNMHKTLQSNQA